VSLPSASEKARYVESMFDRIAGRYDLMNRLMTFGADRGWRRATIEAAGIETGTRVLDLGCGTGDLCWDAKARGAAVVGLDPAARMIELATDRVPDCRFVRAHGEALPFTSDSFDAVVTGFALRNFSDVDAVLAECARVLVPGGRIAILEVDVPRSRLLRTGFDVYFRGVVPLLGRVVSDGSAYSYLAKSLAYLPDEQSLSASLTRAGFSSVMKRRLLGGAAQLVHARKALHA
jgi:demethylmenaquinone methyltransferase / 2-methoxy-6-polyprenyl-1,4-benzoquinol methylase